MSYKQVLVHRHIGKSQYKYQYNGHLIVGKSRLDFILKFTIPLGDFDGLSCKEEDYDCSSILIFIKKNNIDIDLSDDERIFFLQMLVQLAINLDGNSQEQEGICTMSDDTSYDFSHELLEMLSNQKFGCAF